MIHAKTTKRRPSIDGVRMNKKITLTLPYPPIEGTPQFLVYVQGQQTGMLTQNKEDTRWYYWKIGASLEASCADCDLFQVINEIDGMYE